MTGRRRTRIKLAVLAFFAFALAGVAAWAYYVATGNGTANATVASLDTPGTPTASTTVGTGTVNLSWSGVTAPDGTAIDGYYVQRYLGSVPSPACGSSPTSLVTSTSCSDLSVADGTYTYRVTAVLNSWTVQSSASNSVTVINDNTPPALTTLQMFDVDGNGKVDRVVATFDEPLAPYTAGIAPWTLADVPSGGTLSSVTVSGSAATLSLNEGSGPATTARGSFTVALATNADGIRDQYNNQSSFAATAPADEAGPVVVSINRTSASPTNAASVSWLVQFSETVSGVTSTDFVSQIQGPLTSSGHNVVPSSPSSFTVTANDLAGEGDITLRLSDDDTIVDDFFNTLVGLNTADGSFTGQTYAVDRVPPPTPATPDLVDASDSGSSNADNITADNTPTFTGIAENGSTVTVFAGTTSLGSMLITAGTYTITPTTPLTDQNYAITAIAADSVGNISAPSSALPVTVDTVAPAAPSIPDLDATSDSGISNTDNNTNDNTPTFTGSAEPNSTVTILDNGTSVGSSPADVMGAYSATTSLRPDGLRDYTARATDIAGNTGPASNALPVTIDTVAPNVNAAPPDLVAASDTGAFDTDNITMDTTPTVTRTVPNGTIVTLLVDGVPSGTVVVTGGSYTFTVEPPLADGIYILRARVDDLAGNGGTPSDPLSVTIDTVAPAVPGVPDLRSSSDSGNSTDNITNANTPLVFGAVPRFNFVTLFDGGVAVGTNQTDINGQYFITTTLLADGVHPISANATDFAGNTSATGPSLSITIDTVAPAVTLTHVNGAPRTFPYSSNVNVTTVGGACETGAAVVVVTVTGNGAQTGNATCTAGSWTRTFVTPISTDGTSTVTATQNDTAANTGTSGPQTIVVDKTPPPVPSAPDLDPASDSGGSSTDNVTNDATPTVTGTAEPGSTVRIYVDGSGTHAAEGIAAPDGTYSITLPALSDGPHTLTAKTTDSLGNTSAASAGLSVTIDTATPAAPTTPDLDAASDTGSSNTDNNTSDNTLTFTGTGVDGTIVTVYDGTTPVGSVIVSGGTYTVTTSALADGTHSITVKAADTAGNVSAESAPLTVVIDTAAPATPAAPDLDNASDSGSSNTDNDTNDNTPSFSGMAEPGATIKLFDGTTEIGSTTADAAGNYTVTSSALADGPRSITLQAFDTAGNPSSTSAALGVVIDTTAPAVPSAPDLDPASDNGQSSTDDITNDATPTVTGTGEPGSTVRIYVDGSGTHAAEGIVAGDGTWSITVPALADGSHTLTARSLDSAGNLSAPSAGMSITIDTAVPAAPSAANLADASDSGSSNTDNETNVNTPTFTGTGIDGTIVTIFSGTTAVGSAVVSGGTYSVTTSALADGSHSITVKAADTAGNVSVASSALSVTIDTSAPAITPDLAAGSDSGSSNTDNYTNDTTPTFTGTAASGTTVRLFRDGTQVGTVVASGGTWSITPTMAEGVHPMTASATDVAGNVSAAGGTLSVTIDLTAPAPTVTTVNATALSSLKQSASYAANGDTLDSIGAHNASWSGTAAYAPGRSGVAGDQAWSFSGDGASVAAPNRGLGNFQDHGIVIKFDMKLSATGRRGIMHNRTTCANESQGWIEVRAGFGTNNNSLQVVFGGNQTMTLNGTTAVNDNAWHSVWIQRHETGVHGLYIDGISQVFDDEQNATISSTKPMTFGSSPCASDGTGPFVGQLDNIAIGPPSVNQNITSIGGTCDALPGGSATVTLATSPPSGTTWSAPCSGGTWTRSLSLSTDQTMFTLSVGQTDTAGNAGSSLLSSSALTDRNFTTVDKVAPGVTLTTVNGAAATFPQTRGTPVTSVGGACSIDPRDYSFVSIDITGSATQTGTALCNNGTWTYTPTSPLGDGSYTLTATQQDTASNTGTSGARQVTVDTVAPVVTLTHVNGAARTFPYATNVNVTTVGGACQTTEGTVTVTVAGNGAQTGTTSCTANAWTRTLTTAISAEGTSTVTATQTDTVGNTGTSGAQTIIVDRTGPAVTITTVNGTAISGSSALYAANSNTNDLRGAHNASWTGTAAYAPGISGGPTDQAFSFDGSGTSAVVAPTRALSSFQTSAFRVAFAMKLSGTGQRAIMHTRTSCANEAGGYVELRAGMPGAANSVQVELGGSGAVRTLSGSRVVNDNAWHTVGLNREDSGRLELYIDGIFQTALAVSPQSIVSSAPWRFGTTTCTGLTQPFVGQLDNIVIGNPSQQADITSVGGICEGSTTVSVTVVDPARSLTAPCSGHAWTATVSPAIDVDLGTSAFVATQADPVGNQANSPKQLINIDRTPASVSLTTVNGAPATFPHTTGTPVTVIGGSCTTQQRDFSFVTIELTGTVTRTATALCVDGSWSSPQSPSLGDGSYTATVTQNDTNGNVGTSGPIQITVDQTAPPVPAILDLVAASDSGSSSTDNITNDNTLTFTGTGEDGTTITIYDGATPIASAVVTGGVFSITLAPLTDGVHSLTATATDPVGNVSAASPVLSLTIDTVAPPGAPSDPDLVAASDSGSSNSDNNTNDPTPTFTGSGTSGELVALLSDATQVGTVTATGGAYTITPLLAEGVYSMSARYTDIAGNLGTASGALSVTVDLTSASGFTLSGTTGGDNKPSSGDQIVYTYTDQMQAPTIAAGWDGSPLAVQLRFNRPSGSPTSMRIRSSDGGTELNVGSLNLGDESGTRYVGTSGVDVNVTGTMTMTTVDGRSVVTVQLTSNGGFNTVTASTIWTWTPDTDSRNLAGDFTQGFGGRKTHTGIHW